MSASTLVQVTPDVWVDPDAVEAVWRPGSVTIIRLRGQGYDSSRTIYVDAPTVDVLKALGRWADQ